MCESIRNQSLRQNANYKKFNSIYHEVALKAGCPETSLWILYTLYREHDRNTQNELAGYLCVPKQTINAAVSSLKKEGCVALEKIPGMRNSKWVVLTDAGLDKCNEFIAPLIDAEIRTWMRLTEKERKMLLDIYEKRLHIFEEEISGLLSR